MSTYKFIEAKPEDFSVPSAAIREVIRAIREENKMDLHSFILLRKGVRIWEEYFRDGEAERQHVMWSVSKSFTSTAYGIAQAQGLLSVGDKLYDYFPECAASCDSDRKREVTLRHLLMMGSGFENKEEEIFSGGFEYNMAEKALELPVIHEPGTVFNYYTLGTYLLSAAFSKVCPMGVHNYLRQKLFDPMGFGPTNWNTDPNNIPNGGFGLYLRAKDMALLGQLYLQEGIWEGQQLVPVDYVREATSKQIDNGPETPTPHSMTPDWNAGYGYQFWRNSFGGFRADGMHGQYIIVLPEKDTVIVMTSRLDNMQIPLTIIAKTLLREIPEK